MEEESGAEGGGGGISLLVVFMRGKGLPEGGMVKGGQGGVLEGAGGCLVWSSCQLGS